MKWYKLFNSLTEAQNTIKINQHKSFRILTKKICLIHTESGFFAIEDACPHMLASFSKGELTNTYEIECPWHKYRFDIRTGQETTGKNIRNVKTFELEENNKGFCVGMPYETPRDEFSF